MMNKEEKREYDKKYYQANREKRLEQHKQYFQTPMGRASRLLMAYNKEDRKRGRGKGDLTAEWIVERIMSQPCAHCGKSGWEVIGCNRIDNSKPHSKDNVEPCCYDCNLKLARKEEEKQVYQYTLDCKLVRVWASTMECGRNGFDQGAVSKCCNGKLQTYKGYIWSYVPL